MNPSAISRPLLVSALLLGVVWMIASSVLGWSSSMKLVFCDVGQGDATYIRLPGDTDILIDSGPRSEVLRCLSTHMPVYDRTIEYLFLTHPDTDHIGGTRFLAERYTIATALIPAVSRQTDTFTIVLDQLQAAQTHLVFLEQGDTVTIQKLTVQVLWPTRSIMHDANSTDTVFIPAQSGESNQYSLVLWLQYGETHLLLPGDVPASVLAQLPSLSSPVDYLMVPHHGSHDGLTDQFLRRVRPGHAIISSGRNNPHGHPHQEVLSLLRDHQIPFSRTDTDGDIMITADANAPEHRLQPAQPP